MGVPSARLPQVQSVWRAFPQEERDLLRDAIVMGQFHMLYCLKHRKQKSNGQNSTKEVNPHRWSCL